MISSEIVGAPSLTGFGTGSYFASIATHARQVPGRCEIDGEKAWVAAGIDAALHARYGTQQGAA